MKKKLNPRKFRLIFGSILLIILLVFVGLKLWANKNAEAAWFNSNWNYRQRIDVTGISSNQTDYQVKISIDTATLITAGKVQSSCNDIRVTDASGNLLPYWIETGTNACNTATTAIWTKVPSVLTTGTTLYLYYGNSGAASTASGKDTFVFFDDFSGSTLDPTKWTATGAYTISGGELLITTGSVYANNLIATSQQNKMFEMRAKWAATPVNVAGLEINNTLNGSPGSNSESDALSYLISNSSTSIAQTSYAADGSAATYNLTFGTTQFTPTANAYTISGFSYDMTSLKYYQNRTQTNTYNTSTSYAPYLYLGYYLASGSGTQDITDMTIDFVDVRKFVTTEPTATNASEENAPGPIVYWKFDEGTGQTVSNSIQNTHNGTLGANSSVSSDDPNWITSDQCVSQKCLQFDGSADYVSVPTPSIYSSYNTGQLSISAWVNVANFTNSSTIYSEGTSSTTDGWILFYVRSNGQLEFRASNTAASINQYTGTTVLNAERWYHVEVTVSGTSTPILYINGVRETLSVSITSFSGAITGTNQAAIGNFLRNTSSNFMAGEIDELKIYNYARTPSQVDLDYNNYAEKVGLPPAITNINNGLVADWPLDETNVNQSYSRVVNPGVTTGRNIVINGTFDTDTIWSKGTGVTISSGVAHFSAVSPAAGVTQTISGGTLGKVYQLTFTVSNYSAGSVIADIGGNTTAPVASGNGTYTATLAATSSLNFGVLAQTSAFTGDIDNVTVTQLSIPASTATSTQLLTDGDMEVNNTNAWTVGNSATLSKVAGSAHGGNNVLRVARNGVNTPFAKQVILTIGTVYRVTGYGRGDGATGQPRAGDNVNAQFTGSTSTIWQPFDFVFVAAGTDFRLSNISNTGTDYAEFDDVTVSLDTGVRQGELTQDGGMEVWTNSTTLTNWTKSIAGTSTVNQETSVIHGGSNAVRFDVDGSNSNVYFSQPIAAIGKTYVITYWAKSDAASGVSLSVSDNTGVGIGSAQNLTSTYTQYSSTFVATRTGVGFKRNTATSHSIYIDDISITEVDPVVGIPTNGVVLGSASGGHLANAYTFDGVDDNVNIYSSDLNSVFNPSEGTVSIWVKYTGAWNDGVQRTFFHIQVDANNYFQLYKSATDNTLVFDTKFGGTQKAVVKSNVSYSDWFMVNVTWSKSSDQMKVYVNGVQEGSTQTGLGTWVGNFPTTLITIGAANTSGGTPWSGLINDVRLYNRALSVTEINNMLPTDVGTKLPTPVAYYKFDEQQGQTINNSVLNGSILNGTLGATSGASTDDPTWKQSTGGVCKVNGCLNFDGSTDYTTFPNPAAGTFDLSTASILSFSAWINPANGTTADRIFLKGNPYNASGTGYSVLYRGDVAGKPINIQYDDGSVTPCSIFSSGLGDISNVWTHIVVIFNRTTSTVSYYVNGLPAGTNAISSCTGPWSGTTNGNALYVGGNSSFFPGYIDEVKVYNTALTADQVKLDYNAGASQNVAVTANSEASTLSDGAGNPPVGYWNFNEKNGTTANDSSGNGNTGTISAATTTNGIYDSALQFPGSGAVTVGQGSTLNGLTTTATITLWAKANSTGATAGLVDRSTVGNQLLGPFHLWQISGNYQFSIANGASVNTATVAVGDTNWHFISATFDGTKVKIYKDGVLGSSTNQTITPVDRNTSNWVIGAEFYPSGVSFGGKIDEVKIYNYARTQAQIAYDYNRGAPVAWWKFDECQGTTANDSSGNGNTGVITTTATGGNTNGTGTCNTSTSAWGTGATGKINSSLYFDGTGDDVEISNASIIGTNTTFTIAAWIKSASNTLPRTIFGEFTANGDQTRNFLVISGHEISFDQSPPSGGNITSSQSVDDNNWHHVVYTQNGSARKIYIDGKLDAQDNSAETYSGSAPSATRIGYRGSNQEAYTMIGQIDDVRIYNYTLSPAQIQNVYNQGSSVRFGPVTGTP